MTDHEKMTDDDKYGKIRVLLNSLDETFRVFASSFKDEEGEIESIILSCFPVLFSSYVGRMLDESYWDSANDLLHSQIKICFDDIREGKL